MSIFNPIPKKGKAKECSNYRTIALIAHASMEKAMATHSSTLAWKIPWREEPGRLQSMGSQKVDTTERLHFHFHGPGMDLNPAPPFITSAT